MAGKLIKIVGTSAVIILAGNFGYNKIKNNREYKKIYNQFRREVSSLQTPDPNDQPTCQEWNQACSEMGIKYDPRDRENPKPPKDKMEKWLREKGKYTD